MSTHSVWLLFEDLNSAVCMLFVVALLENSMCCILRCDRTKDRVNMAMKKQKKSLIHLSSVITLLDSFQQFCWSYQVTLFNHPLLWLVQIFTQQERLYKDNIGKHKTIMSRELNITMTLGRRQHLNFFSVKNAGVFHANV